ncbi:MAG: hypothetical protein J6S96_04615 [Muribaculaceae bacterium]|nr:hypothetical protein [Muribaculaceae bacterium]
MKRQSLFKFVSVIFTLIVIVIFSSCGNDEPEYKDYYIKYEVRGIYGSLSTVTLIDENNNEVQLQTGNIGTLLTRTIGPVAKGFKAHCNASAGNAITIYCCRGQEPFVTKASGYGDVSYTIDF